MGKCLSNRAPIDCSEFPPGNTEKLPPNDKTTPLIKIQSNDAISGPYRKVSAESERDTDHEQDHINDNYDIVIDENIIIQDFVKIYDEKVHKYHHYGLLLNQKQCKLYLINPHCFYIWKKFEKLSKINNIITSDRHKHKTECNTVAFGQKDAEEMMRNLCLNKLGESSFGNAIDFLMRKNKYEIEKNILFHNDRASFTSITAVCDKYINHLIVTNHRQQHIEFIVSFFRSFGYIVKCKSVDTQSSALHIIVMNDIRLQDIHSLNQQLSHYLSREGIHDIRVQISACYDEINSNHDEQQMGDVKVIDLECLFVSVQPFTEFINHDFDAFLYGFRLKTKTKTHHDLVCLLDDNNKRYEWITHLQYILKNNEFIKRKHSSKLKNKRSNMVNLDKHLFGKNNECNGNNENDTCTYTQRLIAINKLYTNNEDDIVDIITNRNVDIVSIYDSYIHCVLMKHRLNMDARSQCNASTCTHYKRFNAERNSKQNQCIIYILDEIHCFLYHPTSMARRTHHIPNDADAKTTQYFGGESMDYWSQYRCYEDNANRSQSIVFATYDTLKQEVTQNTVCRLNEDGYDDIYNKSMILLSTRYCQSHMKALCDDTLNEKMAIAPGDRVSINHIISMIIYCNYFSVCSKWIQNGNNHNNEAEFAHFYRYLAELCQLFGENMKENEYLYIVTSCNILFKEWHQTIHLPISVTPSLYHNHNDNLYNRNILKLGSLNDRCTRYFDVRWLSDSYDCDMRFMMMSTVRIYDILLDEKTSCLQEIYAIQLLKRIMSGSFCHCVCSLNEMETQKRLFSLIQNHIYSNMKQKAILKTPSFKYIQDIFDDLVRDVFDDGSVIWLNKSELNKLKCKELALCIYNVQQNECGTLLKHHRLDNERIEFVQQYEFKIDDASLKLLIEDNTNTNTITSDDNAYIMDNTNQISLYFELRKRVIMNNQLNTDEDDDKQQQDTAFECDLSMNLILLPNNIDNALIECNVFCDDLNREITFDSVWASRMDTVGGLVLDRNDTKHLNALTSLTFIVALKVLQTNTIRSPAKSIISDFIEN